MHAVHLADTPYFDDCELEHVVLLVTEYFSGEYEGDGWALALMDNGHVREYNLSHCSCYGPFESQGYFGCWTRAIDFLQDVDHVRNINVTENVLNKFVELLLP